MKHPRPRITKTTLGAHGVELVFLYHSHTMVGGGWCQRKVFQRVPLPEIKCSTVNRSSGTQWRGEGWIKEVARVCMIAKEISVPHVENVRRRVMHKLCKCLLKLLIQYILLGITENKSGFLLLVYSSIPDGCCRVPPIKHR